MDLSVADAGMSASVVKVALLHFGYPQTGFARLRLRTSFDLFCDKGCRMELSLFTLWLYFHTPKEVAPPSLCSYGSDTCRNCTVAPQCLHGVALRLDAAATAVG